MTPGDDDERLLEPQQAADEEHQDHAEQLEKQEREENEAEADFEELDEPEERAGHYREVLGRIHGIFRGDEIDFDELVGLSADEQAALSVLAEAVRGTELEDEGDMIYAEHRLVMLNQALAVLSPTLAIGLAPELADLRDSYDQLVDEVTDLRDRLESLGDAQEEMFQQDREAGLAEAPDTDDKPDDDDKDQDKDKEKAKDKASVKPKKDKPKPAAARKPPEAVPEPGEPARPSTLYEDKK